MTLDTPIAFSLMSDKDEGICPVALVGHPRALYLSLLWVQCDDGFLGALLGRETQHVHRAG